MRPHPPQPPCLLAAVLVVVVALNASTREAQAIELKGASGEHRHLKYTPSLANEWAAALADQVAAKSYSSRSSPSPFGAYEHEFIPEHLASDFLEAKKTRFSAAQTDEKLIQSVGFYFDGCQMACSKEEYLLKPRYPGWERVKTCSAMDAEGRQAVNTGMNVGDSCASSSSSSDENAAYACAFLTPFVNEDELYAYVSLPHIGLDGEEYHCCECYEALFTAGEMRGERMKIQVVDTGYGPIRSMGIHTIGAPYLPWVPPTGVPPKSIRGMFEAMPGGVADAVEAGFLAAEQCR